MTNAEHDSLPTYQIPVGELLGQELEARGWSQADFAAVLGRPTQFVSEIVTGKKEITRESAAQIGAALDQSPEYWLKLQDQYLLAEQARNKTTQGRLEEVRRRALLNRKAPIQLLKKRNILTNTTDLDKLEAEVIELLELGSIDDEPAFSAAARRGNHDEGISILQRTWVACVRKAARQQPPKNKYSPTGLQKLASALAHKLQTPADFTDLPDLVAQVGVRLVYVEMLPGGKIDGCAMFVDGYPVIGLSGRGKRLDKILFTLLHEIAHILLAHVDDKRIIAEDLDKHDNETAQEIDANREAAEWTLPSGLPDTPARINGPWINHTATALQVAPIVVIGRLQKRGQLDWRTTLAKNAPNVDHALEAWK